MMVMLMDDGPTLMSSLLCDMLWARKVGEPSNSEQGFIQERCYMRLFQVLLLSLGVEPIDAIIILHYTATIAVVSGLGLRTRAPPATVWNGSFVVVSHILMVFLL